LRFCQDFLGFSYQPYRQQGKKSEGFNPFFLYGFPHANKSFGTEGGPFFASLSI
jgi:hypothetical protein